MGHAEDGGEGVLAVMGERGDRPGDDKGKVGGFHNVGFGVGGGVGGGGGEAHPVG